MSQTHRLPLYPRHISVLFVNSNSYLTLESIIVYLILDSPALLTYQTIPALVTISNRQPKKASSSMNSPMQSRGWTSPSREFYPTSKSVLRSSFDRENTHKRISASPYKKPSSPWLWKSLNARWPIVTPRCGR